MNVLIVDDQERILTVTQKMVNWKNLHIDKVFAANRAAEARKILAEESVDIMLLDIEMPGENGISLHRWQMEEYPSVACIFLTSHADFSYAREALHQGAFDYILQPASIAEIEDGISRCIRSLEERRAVARRNSEYDKKISQILESHVFVMFYQSNHFLHTEEWKRDSGTLERDWFYMPILIELWQINSEVIEKELNQMLEGTFHYVVSRLDSSRFGILLYSREMEWNREEIGIWMEQIRKELSWKYKCEMNIYLGNHTNEDLPQKIGKVMRFRTGRILKRNEVYWVDEAEALVLRKPDGLVWSRWLVRGDVILVRNQISNLLRYAEQEHQLTVTYLQQLVYAFMEACTIACSEKGKKLSDLFGAGVPYEQMLGTSSPQELKQGVKLCLEQYEILTREGDEEQEPSTSEERIREILRYLDENMDQMISRREAAKYVFLNEDYFSRIFKKETGMGYKEYLIRHKMDYAGKLLAATDLSVVLVASRVGYDNYTNFIQTFRRIIGYSPSEYRKMCRNVEGKTAKSEK